MPLDLTPIVCDWFQKLEKCLKHKWFSTNNEDKYVAEECFADQDKRIFAKGLKLLFTYC